MGSKRPPFLVSFLSLVSVILVAAAVGRWPSRASQTTSLIITWQPTAEAVVAATPLSEATAAKPSPSPAPTQTILSTPTPQITAQTNPAQGSGTVSARTTATKTPRPTASPSATARPSLTPTITPSAPVRRRLGLSTLGHPIDVHQFGDGPVRLAFVGGIHGGYEWNTILLAYRAIDYFTARLKQLPDDVSLYIIPSANPDGQAQLLNHTGRFLPSEVISDTFTARFNGNEVDLNRNWDCNWAAEGYWGTSEVSAGSEPFSEVETQILSEFLSEMRAVVFWHSAKPGVFFGECDAPFPESEALAAVYAEAAGYPLYEGFVDYSVTGAASDWLALQGVPAIAVELTDHTDIDWRQNLAGMLAVIEAFRKTGVPSER
jgi:predicted deacylase